MRLRMSIHYKFKAAKDFDTVSFDGNAISLGELKNRIIDAKGLGKALDFDLAIQNAQTNEGEGSAHSTCPPTPRSRPLIAISLARAAALTLRTQSTRMTTA